MLLTRPRPPAQLRRASSVNVVDDDTGDSDTPSVVGFNPSTPLRMLHALHSNQSHSHHRSSSSVSSTSSNGGIRYSPYYSPGGYPTPPRERRSTPSRHLRKSSLSETDLLLAQNADLLLKISQLEDDAAHAERLARRRLRRMGMLEREVEVLKSEVDQARGEASEPKTRQRRKSRLTLVRNEDKAFLDFAPGSSTGSTNSSSNGSTATLTSLTQLKLFGTPHVSDEDSDYADDTDNNDNELQHNESDDYDRDYDYEHDEGTIRSRPHSQNLSNSFELSDLELSIADAFGNDLGTNAHSTVRSKGSSGMGGTNFSTRNHSANASRNASGRAKKGRGSILGLFDSHTHSPDDSLNISPPVSPSANAVPPLSLSAILSGAPTPPFSPTDLLDLGSFSRAASVSYLDENDASYDASFEDNQDISLSSPPLSPTSTKSRSNLGLGVPSKRARIKRRVRTLGSEIGDLGNLGDFEGNGWNDGDGDLRDLGLGDEDMEDEADPSRNEDERVEGADADADVNTNQHLHTFVFPSVNAASIRVIPPTPPHPRTFPSSTAFTLASASIWDSPLAPASPVETARARQASLSRTVNGRSGRWGPRITALGDVFASFTAAGHESLKENGAKTEGTEGAEAGSASHHLEFKEKVKVESKNAEGQGKFENKPIQVSSLRSRYTARRVSPTPPSSTAATSVVPNSPSAAIGSRASTPSTPRSPTSASSPSSRPSSTSAPATSRELTTTTSSSLSAPAQRLHNLVTTFFLWAQFIVVLGVFVWAVAKAGPKALTADGEKPGMESGQDADKLEGKKESEDGEVA